MAVLGPNCNGLLSAPTGAALWPDVHGLVRRPRGVALLSQSGNIAVNLTMGRRGLDVAWVISLGNQADVGISEAFEAVVADAASVAADAGRVAVGGGTVMVESCITDVVAAND